MPSLVPIWAETIAEPIPEERIDYQVHLKYVQRVARLSRGLSARCSLIIVVKVDAGPFGVYLIDERHVLVIRSNAHGVKEIDNGYVLDTGRE